MQSDSGVPAVLYFNAWLVLAILLLYYLTLVLVFRVSGSRRAIKIVQYEPPKHISPAVAAYLTEGGICERAFASSLVSLSRQGFLELGQDKDHFWLKKLREADGSLPPEESLILSSLFFGLSCSNMIRHIVHQKAVLWVGSTCLSSIRAANKLTNTWLSPISSSAAAKVALLIPFD